jgi:hypothetical protein
LREETLCLRNCRTKREIALNRWPAKAIERPKRLRQTIGELARFSGESGCDSPYSAGQQNSKKGA